jgi:Group 4 capsule polysaccharide lipoprotein gfcB, YjbF
MRIWLAVVLPLVLGACTQEGLNPIVAAGIQEVNPFDEDKPEAKPAQPVTRAAIARSGVATIRARLVKEKSPTYLFAAANNGGYITYASSLRQTLTLNGSWITGSRGLGWDLLSATSSQPDPLTRPIPPGRWPSVVKRSYEFPASAPQGTIETFECRYEPGAVKDQVILEVRHRGVEISETCTGPSGSFENLHFADISTGFVWRSLQWLGPRQGLIDLEIVDPYTGSPG